VYFEMTPDMIAHARNPEKISLNLMLTNSLSCL
jgi:hypothetical protein